MSSPSTAKSDYRTALRLLNLVRRQTPSALPTQLLRAMLEAWSPFIVLFFTARLIDRLAAAAWDAAVVTAVWLVGASFLLEAAKQYLSAHAVYQYQQVENTLWLALRKKALGLDYAAISDPENARLVLGPDESSMYCGGISSLVDHARTVTQQLLSAGTALVMALSLCFSPGRAAGALRVLASPAVSLAVLAAGLSLSVGLALRVNRRFRALRQQNVEEHISVEQGLNYLIYKVFLNQDAGKVIRLYGMGEMLSENYDRYNGFMRKVYVDMCNQDLRQALLSQLLAGVFSILAYGVVLLKILAGAITAGTFAQYAGALAAFQSAILALVQEDEEIRRQVQYLGKYLDFLALESTHTGTIPVEKRLDHVYEIEFHHVTFAYPGSAEPVLKDVSCKLTLKGKMAVVGLNGAGKTTFIKLLCRLYDPTEGSIDRKSVV